MEFKPNMLEYCDAHFVSVDNPKIIPPTMDEQIAKRKAINMHHIEHWSLTCFEPR
jgi:hypothetical protein